MLVGLLEDKKMRDVDQAVDCTDHFFSRLPNELILHIFSFLSSGELVKCSLTSKKFHLLTGGNALWKLFCSQVIPSFQPDDQNYKQRYGVEFERMLGLNEQGLLPLQSPFYSIKPWMLHAVKQYGSALQYAAKEIRGDREIVLEAVKQSGQLFQYATEELKSDREVVLEVVKKNGALLVFAAEELKRDKQVVLETFKQNGYALQYAAEELRRDREVVLEAVKQNGEVLEYAAKELKRDREVVLEAVKQNEEAYRYADGRLKRNREVMLKSEKVKKRIKITSAELVF